MVRDEQTYAIIGAALEVHRQLGRGFTEYVYQDALQIELANNGIPHEREKRMVVEYKGIQLRHDYIADFVCFNDVVVECKAVSCIQPEHEAQLLNYMKVSGIKKGLLLNFGEMSLVHKRFVN